MSPRSQSLRAERSSSIENTESIPDSREVPLHIGDWVQLNSGGPRALVMDIENGEVTIALRNGHAGDEQVFPRAAVRRID